MLERPIVYSCPPYIDKYSTNPGNSAKLDDILWRSNCVNLYVYEF